MLMATIKQLGVRMLCSASVSLEQLGVACAVQVSTACVQVPGKAQMSALKKEAHMKVMQVVARSACLPVQNA